MARFYASILPIVEAPVWDPKYLEEVVHENNDKVTVWEDRIENRIYIECENKPRDMPLHGVFWNPSDDQR